MLGQPACQCFSWQWDKNVEWISSYTLSRRLRMALTENGATIAVLRNTIVHGAFTRLSRLMFGVTSKASHVVVDRRKRKPVNTMLDPTTDDDGIYLRKSSIDRSVSYLIAGVVVLLFFLMVVLGMGRIQHLTDGATATNRFTPEEKVPEIGDAEGSGVKD